MEKVCTNDGWIPVSDRLPNEYNKEILIVTYILNDIKHVTTATYHDDGWYSYDQSQIPINVIAWQQLPKTYEE